MKIWLQRLMSKPFERTLLAELWFSLMFGASKVRLVGASPLQAQLPAPTVSHSLTTIVGSLQSLRHRRYLDPFICEDLDIVGIARFILGPPSERDTFRHFHLTTKLKQVLIQYNDGNEETVRT